MLQTNHAHYGIIENVGLFAAGKDDAQEVSVDGVICVLPKSFKRKFWQKILARILIVNKLASASSILVGVLFLSPRAIQMAAYCTLYRRSTLVFAMVNI